MTTLTGFASLIAAPLFKSPVRHFKQEPFLLTVYWRSESKIRQSLPVPDKKIVLYISIFLHTITSDFVWFPHQTQCGMSTLNLWDFQTCR